MLGPIFSVEMLTIARRGRYFVLRVLYACMLFFALVVTYQTVSDWDRVNTLSQSANVASAFFQSFSILQLLTVLFVGPAMAAGTIAVERERRTIEYLFATDLTNREIVLGKLTARFSQITSLVLVGLPILSAAMLMGGIAPEQLLAVFLITVSTMAVVAVLAVTMSVWAMRVRDAVTRVYVVLFAALFVPTAMIDPLARIWGFYYWIKPLIIACYAINPFYALAGTIWGGWSGGGNIDWQPLLWLLGSHAVLIVLLASLAVWAVRRVHLRESGQAPAKLPRRVLRTSRSPWETFPLVWKELATARSASRMGIVARIASWIIILAAVGPMLFWYFTSTNDDSTVGLTIVADFLGCAGLLIVATRAATCITSEREKDTWITLLGTPVSNTEIVVGKAAGSLYAGRYIILMIAGLMLLQVWRTPLALVGIPFSLGTLTILALFASALGIFYSLRSANSTRALGWTLATALFVGGGYLFCCAPLGLFGAADEFILALCVPMLLFVPSQTLVEPDFGGALFATYVVGVCLYGVAALAAYGVIVNRFDTWNGRIDGDPSPRHRPG